MLIEEKRGATIFAYRVNDPQRYGIVEFSKNNKVISIEEKPKNPKSQFAIIGLYYYDNSVVEKTKNIEVSERGEFRDYVNKSKYLKEKTLRVETLGRGIAWFDTGTTDSLHEASGYIKTLQNRQGLMIGSPEEIAWRSGWINNNQLIEISSIFKESKYGKYLRDLPSLKNNVIQFIKNFLSMKIRYATKITFTSTK